jgi:PAS domain S-box-containing protein
LFVDSAGVPYTRTSALESLRAAANAPIVGLFENDLGRGILGGPLLSLQDQSRETAQVAVRILKGERPGTIPTQVLKPGKPLYDWRELQRWGIRETQLPMGSEVRFRPPNFVQQYRREIAALLGFSALESALIVALVRQLRRRRQVERSLRESEERLTLAATAAGLGIWEWDLVNNQIWATGPNLARIDAEDSGRTDFDDFLQLVHPDDRTMVSDAVAKSVRGDGHYENVHRTAFPDGQTRWVSVRGRVEFDDNLKPLRMRGVSLDITTRKQAEELAKESERRFLLMANSAPVLIWASGPNKLCNFFNQPWLDFTGRTLEQELGDGWAQGVHPDDLAKCLSLYVESFDARVPFTMEYRLRRRDGQYRWISDHGVPRYDALRNFLGYIGSCVDVTERRQAEAEAQQARQELAHLTRVSTMGELAGSLAHELNQPLTAILSNAQAAQRFLNATPPNVGEVKEILKDIADEDRRAAEVIVRLRAMLKKGDAQTQPQDVNEVIHEVLGIMRSDLVVRHVAAESCLRAGLPRVGADRIQLQQVLLNLIMNACDAMTDNSPGDRRLTISTEFVDAGLVQVAVADRGSGFAPEKLGRIFEPFRTTKPNGLGLGLPICRSIISAHGGRLWATNNTDRGATVRFTLNALEEVAI